MESKYHLHFHPWFVIVVLIPLAIAGYYLIQLIEALKANLPLWFAHNWGFVLIACLLMPMPLYWRGYKAIMGHVHEAKDRAAYRALLEAATEQARKGYNLEMINPNNGATLKLTNPFPSSVQVRQVEAVDRLALPSGTQQDKGIPDVVRYAEIANEVPPDMSLLGIHPDNGNLELTLWEKLKCVWLVGSSSTGKSNTIFGKAYEATEKGAKLLAVDQHAGKDDSLARKLAPLSSAFLRPVAIKDQEVLGTLDWFKTEFERRVSCPCGQRAKRCAACSQKIVLICDEMNRMARKDALIKPLKEIVAICGEESRGFGMYGWFLSQKCAGLKWLRDSAITVIVHRLTRFEEAKLACNENRNAANRLLNFPVGRTFVYGVDFDGLLELQQPLYDTPAIVETNLSYVESEDEPEEESEEDFYEVQTESISSTINNAVPVDGQPTDHTFPYNFSQLKEVRKLLMERRNQNDIICEVWNVQENTRAFRSAKEEFRQMLAYLASMVGEV